MTMLSVCPGVTSTASGERFAPGKTLPVALLTHLYPRRTGFGPVAGHTRPPSLVAVTVMTRVSPAVQLIGTLSLTQSTLQSAERNATSRTGVLYSEFHHCPFVCRSQRTV